MKGIRAIVKDALEMVYPRRAVCLCCNDMSGCEGDWLCPGCRLRLRRAWIGPGPGPADSGFEGAAYAYHYTGPAGCFVRQLKYKNAYALAEWMAADMVKAFENLEPAGVDMVVPVPMHWLRRYLRSANQSEVLAAIVARQKRLPCVEALTRVRHTTQQARLSGQRRRNNLKGAVRANMDLTGMRILLVDDVCTTGTTAIACEKALRAAGAANVYLLCYTQAKE